jgi:hypothetical protein
MLSFVLGDKTQLLGAIGNGLPKPLQELGLHAV